MKKAGATKGGLVPLGLRLEHGNWDGGAFDQKPNRKKEEPAVPEFLTLAATAQSDREMPLSPSDLGGEKILGGGALEEESAMRRGRQIHKLLEHLPGHHAPFDLAERLLSKGADKAVQGDIQSLTELALRSIEAYPELFSTSTLTEVDIAAHLSRSKRPMIGRIDRLIVTGDRVLAIDFKTNAIVPKTAEDTPDRLASSNGRLFGWLGTDLSEPSGRCGDPFGPKPRL